MRTVRHGVRRAAPRGTGSRLAAAGLLVLALPALAACGFKPVYGARSASAVGSGAPASVQLNQVFIDPLPDRSGQVLRNKLIDRFYHEGRPSDPAYRLAIQLAAQEEDLGIRQDATATRARLRLVASYELIDNRTGQPVYRTFSRAIISYNLLEAQYATLVAQQDAYDRGLTQLADEIQTRLALFFAREPEPAPAAASPG
ncbi:LPS assembly lipoprotein LptE [Rhodospirillum centenum]|uniref:LPS-assembly lipoprotein n=1 Tax=Rhodospirillum centenum (strain ATCC 51521 / SW) TaxID=414684 RepID=B6IU55_RHOCS|nr:LPS assembly lipoprotein LptE [Rhodospirillum centenum]ACI99932.1 conserved hypothetical protein [Rhodospirillum centenum SW]